MDRENIGRHFSEAIQKEPKNHLRSFFVAALNAIPCVGGSMAALFEDPLPAIFVGVIVESILIALFFATQKRLWIIPIAGVLLLLFALVLVERLVITEREEVENTIDEIAAAILANDVEAVLSHLSDSNRKSRARARWAMDRVEVHGVKLSGLEITVNSLTSPPSAKRSMFGI